MYLYHRLVLISVTPSSPSEGSSLLTLCVPRSISSSFLPPLHRSIFYIVSYHTYFGPCTKRVLWRTTHPPLPSSYSIVTNERFHPILSGVYRSVQTFRWRFDHVKTIPVVFTVSLREHISSLIHMRTYGFLWIRLDYYMFRCPDVIFLRSEEKTKYRKSEYTR